MSLTKAWFDKIKKDNKVGPKSAPETPFEVALKSFDADKTKLDKAPTDALCESTLKALKTMEDRRKTSGDAVYAAGFHAVAEEIWAAEGWIRKEKTLVKELRERLGLQQLRDKAANNEEATYDTLWNVYSKQREACVDKPSLLLFKTCKSSLEKLEHQAAVCGASSLPLLGKYNKQAHVIETLRAERAAHKVSYTAALAKAVKDRQELLRDMSTLEGLQRASLARLLVVKGVAVGVATTTKNAFELMKLKKACKAIVDDASDKHEAFTVTFAPGTTIRDSSDVKQARIHTTESLAVVQPLSDQIFTVNKSLLALVKQIRQMADEIQALQAK